MSDTTSMNLRIDKNLKQDAEILFDSLGISMTTAINIFLRQAVRDQGIPFRVSAVRPGDDVLPCRGNFAEFYSHDAYVAERLKAADKKAAEGRMKYYTADEIRAGLEEVLGEKV